MTPTILEQTISDFRASSDQKAFGRKEAWRRFEGDGPFGADCDDFVLTLLYRIAGKSDAVFWSMLKEGEAKIIHVLSDRGVDHVVLWVKGLGYIDSSPSKMARGWRPELEYRDKGTYTVQAIRDKLADKSVPAPDDAKKSKKLLLLAGLAGAVAVFFALGGFQ